MAHDNSGLGKSKNNNMDPTLEEQPKVLRDPVDHNFAIGDDAEALGQKPSPSGRKRGETGADKAISHTGRKSR